jgi:hypothetical protein
LPQAVKHKADGVDQFNVTFPKTEPERLIEIFTHLPLPAFIVTYLNRKVACGFVTYTNYLLIEDFLVSAVKILIFHQ